MHVLDKLTFMRVDGTTHLILILSFVRCTVAARVVERACMRICASFTHMLETIALGASIYISRRPFHWTLGSHRRPDQELSDHRKGATRRRGSHRARCFVSLHVATSNMQERYVQGTHTMRA